MQEDVGVGVAGDVVGAAEVQHARGAHLVDAPFGRTRVGGLGGFALQAEEDRLDGAVSVAGGAERAEQLTPHPPDALEQPVGPEPLGEGVRRPHRADGVRAGGPDAHGEEVER